MKEGIPLSDKVEAFGECITRRMSIRAIENNALNLAQGFPTEDPPTEMLAAAIRSINEHRNYYADMRGDPMLRQVIADYSSRFNGMNVNGNDHVTVTCGTTEAMIATLLAIINPGDEVILFEPWYENYWPQIILTGAIFNLYTLEPPDYRVDFERLEAAFTNKTRAIIINTPNNPTGRVFSQDEMDGIARLCQKYNTYAIVDEIYHHIVFDDHRHISLATLDGMSERTIVVNGVSKAFAATGWRVGWAIAPVQQTLAIRRVHDFLTGTVPTPFQDGSIAGLNLADTYFENLKQKYRTRRQLLASSLNAADIDFFLPEGTYYILADIGDFGFTSSEDFAQALITEAGVAVVPGNAFFNTQPWRERMIRLTFSKDDETLKQAGAKIVRWALNRPRTTLSRGYARTLNEKDWTS